MDLGIYHPPSPFNGTVFHLSMYDDKYNKRFVDECIVFSIFFHYKL